MARAAFRVPGLAAIASINVPASAYSVSVRSSSSAPAFQSSINASESPIPALIISGSPHARYSAFLVGDDAILEKQLLIKDNPASAAERYDGTCRAGTESTLKRSSGTFRLFINCFTRAWLDRKSTRLNSSHLVISYAVFCLK